jgi:glutaminyl-peptide cyclotransferase
LSSLNSPDPDKILELVKWQTVFGPRFPGSDGHLRFVTELTERFKTLFPEFHAQDFEIVLRGRVIKCMNLIGVKKAFKSTAAKPLLIGTHFDTRLLADNEQDPQLKHKPIIGANDGGSGTAILLALAEELEPVQCERDIYLVLFDAEDIGNIGGYDFGMGARFYSQHPIPKMPEEVLILDMVGGKNMILDIDLNLFTSKQSLILAQTLINLGVKRGFPPFIQNKPQQHKYIICDHTPFVKLGIPTFIFIDLDYPQWHTHGDLPQAMCKESLGMIAQVLVDYLNQFIKS